MNDQFTSLRTQTLLAPGSMEVGRLGVEQEFCKLFEKLSALAQLLITITKNSLTDCFMLEWYLFEELLRG